MPFEIEYGTFANYSPRGTSELSVRSQRICGAIKAGKTEQIERAVPHLEKPISRVLRPYLNSNVVSVPVPRSAPLAKDALWPAKVIADVLAQNGFGGEVLPLIERVMALRKSSSSPANERPLIHEHVDSMRLNMELTSPSEITIIDDVLTLGRTMCACERLLSNAFPEARIRAFAMIRTQGFEGKFRKILDPSVGTIIGYQSGKSHRDP